MMATYISSEGQEKSWMRIRTSRFKENLLRSRIDLLEKINMKRKFFCMMTDRPAIKVSYILDAQNNEKKILST